MYEKVLILSASAGHGHIRAAQALERAFALAPGSAAREVRHVDTLQFTNPLFRRLYSKAYIDAVNNAPTALGWLYDYLDKPWTNEKKMLAFDRRNTGPLIEMLDAFPAWKVLLKLVLVGEVPIPSKSGSSRYVAERVT